MSRQHASGRSKPGQSKSGQSKSRSRRDAPPAGQTRTHTRRPAATSIITAPRSIGAWAPDAVGSIRVVVARTVPIGVVIVGVAVAVLGVFLLGAVIAVIGGALFLVNEITGRAARVVARIGGRVLTPAEQPGLRNIVEGLCVTSGQAVPELRVLDDDAPNALVLFRRRSETVLIFTSGLLRDLERIELEGVVAHELAHIKNGDARRAAHAIVACGTLARFSDATPRFVLALGDPRREILADLGGSAITRYPRGLHAALNTIANAPTSKIESLDAVAYRLTAALWCAPLNSGQPQRVRAGVLDLDLRVEALAEL